MLDDRFTEAGDPPAPELYRFDIRRVRPAELYRLSGGPLGFPIAFLLFKVFRQRLPLGDGVARPEEIVPVAPEQVPAPLRALVEPAVAACEAAGFRRLLVYSVPMRMRDTEGVAVALCDEEGTIAASVITSESRSGGRVQRECVVSFGSPWPDGRYLLTTNFRRRFDHPPELDVEHHPKASPGELLARHRERMEAVGPGAFERIRPEDVPRLVLEQEQRWFDFQRSRGVIVPLTAPERRQVLDPTRAPSSRLFGQGFFKWLLIWIVCFSLLVLAFQTC